MLRKNGNVRHVGTMAFGSFCCSKACSDSKRRRELFDEPRMRIGIVLLTFIIEIHIEFVFWDDFFVKIFIIRKGEL